MIQLLLAVALAPAPPEPLRGYLEIARDSNLAFRREAIDVEVARERLNEARSFLLPRLEASARYSVASGGRTIDIPVGDLVNPVYATLNDLLVAGGGDAAFGTVGNQSIELLRPHEQETFVRIVQPLWRPEIARGIEAKRSELASREAQLGAFARELDLEVRTAYFRWIAAEAAIGILDGAQALVDENARVQRSLFRNDKVTEDAPLRAEAEVAAVREQRIHAAKQADVARSYVNFLMNRPLGTPLEPIEAEALTAYEREMEGWAAGGEPDGARREELAALGHAVDAAESGRLAERARLFPTVAFAADAGIEGSGYGPGERTRFSQASLVASWVLFDGAERRSRIRQAELERRKLEVEREETASRIDLQIREARDEAAAASAAVEAARSRVTAAARSFEIADRRQHEGVLNFLGVLDARQERTEAELRLVIRRTERLIAIARLMRATATEEMP
ncbi:MAG TPA: TolC family protein [Candidatus Polarisedimenticolaceae bacterium]